MRHLRLDSEEEYDLLRRALDHAATGTPRGGDRNEDAGVADRLLIRLDATPDVPEFGDAMRHVREALGLCEARVGDLSGTGRRSDHTRVCGATLREDGACPAAVTHI